MTSPNGVLLPLAGLRSARTDILFDALAPTGTLLEKFKSPLVLCEAYLPNKRAFAD
jgi:hypothetical protein